MERWILDKGRRRLRKKKERRWFVRCPQCDCRLEEILVANGKKFDVSIECHVCNRIYFEKSGVGIKRLQSGDWLDEVRVAVLLSNMRNDYKEF